MQIICTYTLQRFVVLIVLYASCVLITVLVALPQKANESVLGWKFALYIIFESLYLLFSTLSTTLIAICMANQKETCTRSLEADNGSEAISLAKNALKEFQAAKAGISPLLFLAFSTKCVMLCNHSMTLILEPVLLLAIFFIHIVVELMYVAILADDTFSCYRSLPSKLR